MLQRAAPAEAWVEARDGPGVSFGLARGRPLRSNCGERPSESEPKPWPTLERDIDWDCTPSDDTLA